MALTQDQWFQKLKALVPSWWFEKQKYSVALFEAIASIFVGINLDADDQFASTFITQSIAPALDMLGQERSIPRLTGEPNNLYAPRVQQITSNTNIVAIQKLINSLMTVGQCKIIESPQGNPYASRGTFLSRYDYLIDTKSNYFLVIIPPQTHVPYSFLSRDSYDSEANASRGHFIGSLDSTTAIFSSIIAAVNQMKAFGVMYGIVETTAT